MNAEPLYLSLWAWNVCKFDPLFKKKSLGSEIEIKDVSVVLSERLSWSEHHKFQVSVNKMSTRWQTSNIPHTCALRQKFLTGVEELVSTRWKKKDLKLVWMRTVQREWFWEIEWLIFDTGDKCSFQKTIKVKDRMEFFCIFYGVIVLRTVEYFVRYIRRKKLSI